MYRSKGGAFQEKATALALVHSIPSGKDRVLGTVSVDLAGCLPRTPLPPCPDIGSRLAAAPGIVPWRVDIPSVGRVESSLQVPELAIWCTPIFLLYLFFFSPRWWI